MKDERELETLRAELRDRYGPLPPEVGLAQFAALRLRAEALAVIQVDLGAGALAVRFDERTPVAPPDPLVRVAGERTGARVLPDGLRWPVGAGETQPSPPSRASSPG